MTKIVGFSQSRYYFVLTPLENNDDWKIQMTIITS